MKTTLHPAKEAIRLITLCVLFIILQACVSRPSLEHQASIALNNNLAQLENWKLKGKIAWLTPAERKSAYISWQQNKDNMQFDLNNLLGINLASMHYNGITATLSANDEEFTDTSPSLLIYKTTGWQVPIESLRFWIKGATNTEGRGLNEKDNVSKQATIERYPNGLVKQIKPTCATCNQWTIDYKSYTQVSISNKSYQLPKLISLYNPAFDATIKISVSTWSE